MAVPKDLRGFIQLFEEEGELIRIKHELNPKFEIPGVIKEFSKEEGGPALLFENVKGYNVPIVSNIFGSMKRIARFLELEEGGSLLESFMKKKSLPPIPPKVVEWGPVKENVKKDVNLFDLLPILTYHKRDSDPYITAGIVFSKDPETGSRSMGIHRLQVKPDGKRLGVLIPVSRLEKNYAKAEKMGKPLDVAIAIGSDPVTVFSSIVFSPPGFDKYDLAGAFRGEPVEIVKGETVDIEVPAHAEVIIEGRLLPHIREDDGPFGESTGHYFSFKTPVIEITAVLHRNNPIYHVIQPWSFEDDNLIGFAFGGELFNQLKRLVPQIKDMRLMPGTMGMSVVFSVSDIPVGEIKRALYLALSVGHVKKAIVVDDDIDIYNDREVEWALTMRCQPKDDVIIIPEIVGVTPDLTTKRVGEQIVTSKIGIDCTKPKDKWDDFEKLDIPQDIKGKVREIASMYKR